jgi:hypothetical protein
MTASREEGITVPNDQGGDFLQKQRSQNLVMIKNGRNPMGTQTGINDAWITIKSVPWRVYGAVRIPSMSMEAIPPLRMPESGLKLG